MTFREAVNSYYSDDEQQRKILKELHDIVLEKSKNIDYNVFRVCEIFIRREKICLVFESEKYQEIIYVQIYEDFTAEQVEYSVRREKVDDGSLVLDTTVCMKEATDIPEIIENIIQYLKTQMEVKT